MIYLLAAYMWLFIHRPFEVWPWLGEYRIERVFMLVTLAFWAIAAEKTWIRNRVNVGVLALVAAVLCSSLMSPYSEFFNRTVEDWLKIVVFYVLVLSSIRDERDLRRLVVVFLVAMGLYMSHSFREFLCGRHVYRMGVARMVGVDITMNHPNSFGATVLYGLPMVWPVWALAKKRWHYALLIGYVLLSVTCIMATGSRTAFIGLCILLLIIGLLSRHRFKVLATLVVAAPLVWMNLSGDLRNRYMTIIDPNRGPANAQVSADSRWIFFEKAVELWKDNPVLGVGPGSFPKASGTGMSVHSIYGQLLGELGIVGMLAFAVFLFALVANTITAIRLRNEIEPHDQFNLRVALAVGIAIPLLLFGGLGGHNLFRYTWLYYAAFQAIAIHCIYMSLQQEAADELFPEDVSEGEMT